MKPTLRLLFVLPALAAALLAAPPPQLVDIDGRMGPIVTLADGRLFAAYEQGRRATEWQKVDTPQFAYGRFSSDHGLHWSPPQKLFEFPAGLGAVAGVSRFGGRAPGFFVARGP